MGSYVSKPSSPPRIASDTVIPLHYFDDNSMLRSFVPEVTLRFDDVLDVDKIRNALDRLLSRKGWRKLGARVRFNSKGKLEYHIPETYTPDRPGYILTEDKYNVRIEEHPVGAQLPHPVGKDKTRPLFFGDPFSFASITRHPDTPKTMEKWLHCDVPQLFFHVTSFENATLFTTTWPHTLADAMGFSMILNSISLILQGKDHYVPEYLGAEEDLLQTLGTTANPKDFVLHDYLLSGFAGLRFGLYLALDMFINRRNTLRAICVPHTYFQRIYEETLGELNLTIDPKSTCRVQLPDEKFVSESDVLFAWWSRMLLSALKPRRRDAPVGLMNVFDYRAEFPHLLPKQGVYVGNATFGGFTLLTCQQILTSTLGFVAQRLRNSLNEQRTRPQIEAVAAAHREALDKTGFTAMFGQPDQYLFALSNWHRAKLFQVDFSAALVDPAKKEQNRLAGKPSYVHPVGYNNGFAIRNFGAVSGRDHEGNWWLSWFTGDDTWDIIEKEMAKLLD
ncbi:uncharacterized protein PV09_07069 [Verruconis gallopava]|uniref:Uncharacterized protein n=1 Tax=Verruconis gallopava TaxID=253628 RepID=A0A0D1YLA9_9PEZI|nr:uncharacterized protein PV09_07069 [Verruconis gallopava]KIW01597.1 hypothetical protein PV09_07069 [Verruconis gallopava]